jgi:hypothetical protein
MAFGRHRGQFCGALMNRLLLCSAWVGVMGVMGLTGCASLSTSSDALINFQPETFSSKDTHSRRFDQAPGVTCEAARRALLSQGYIISEAKADHVRARKFFQPGVEHHVELEFRVVCVSEGPDRRVTMAFVNGVQDQYGMRKVKSSASLGVGGVGSLSLPVQGDNDTMVKIASETVTDHQMYQRLFDLMQRHLDPYASLNDTDAATAEDKQAASRIDKTISKPVPAPAPVALPSPAPVNPTPASSAPASPAQALAPAVIALPEAPMPAAAASVSAPASHAAIAPAAPASVPDAPAASASAAAP